MNHTAKTTTTYVLVLAVIVMLFIGFTKLMEIGFEGHEQYECQRWQAEAKTYEGYYLASWQKAQCDHYNISIEAPVQ